MLEFYENLRSYIIKVFLLVYVANLLFITLVLFSLFAYFMHSLVFNSSVYLNQLTCQSLSESPSYLRDPVIGEIVRAGLRTIYEICLKSFNLELN